MSTESTISVATAAIAAVHAHCPSIKATRKALEETEGYLVMTLEALHSHSHGIAVNFDRIAAGLSNNLAAVRAAHPPIRGTKRSSPPSPLWPKPEETDMTDKVSTAMMEKWNATPFDETDRIEQVAERARQFLVNAALDKISELDAENGEEVSAMLAGFTVAYASIALSFVPRSDEVDRTFVKAIASHGEWAVDMVRAHEGKLPLRGTGGEKP